MYVANNLFMIIRDTVTRDRDSVTLIKKPLSTPASLGPLYLLHCHCLIYNPVIRVQ